MHVATGYEKWGMANAVAAARTITADILGDVPSWAAVLAGRRVRPAGAAEAVRDNLGVGAAGSHAGREGARWTGCRAPVGPRRRTTAGWSASAPTSAGC